jgi:cyclic pyranopterin phosphate synthase
MNINLILGCSIKFVEIEVNSKCNRQCSYCPVSILPPPPVVPEYMEEKIFKSVIDALTQIRYFGIISYHLYSEPLLRNDLEYLIAQVKNKIPNAFQVIYSNGDNLTDKRYNSLINAGIDLFIVTRHSQTPIIERPKQIIKFPNELIINNRGGILSKLDKPLTLPCYSPSERLIVTITGDILLCCNDAGRTNVMGNLGEKSLEEIWFNNEFKKKRELLRKGNRADAAKICEYCDDIEYCKPSADYNLNFDDIIKKIGRQKNS